MQIEFPSWPIKVSDTAVVDWKLDEHSAAQYLCAIIEHIVLVFHWDKERLITIITCLLEFIYSNIKND